MSDKELDNLFKSKFEDAEFAPSEALWGKIEKQLEKPKKRTYPIFWMAAASVTLTVGSFFMLEKTDKMQLYAETQNVKRIKEIVSNVEEPVKYNSSPMQAPDEMDETTTKVTPVVLAKQSSTSATIDKTNAKRAGLTEALNAEPTMQIAKNENISNSVQPIENTRRLDNTNPEVINNNSRPTQLGLTDEQPNAIKTEFALAAHDADGEDRKVIKNVGDLVNFVVDKVDKRDQKFLKFSPDDDDSMRLVGINIGLLKWNKKK
ncbi:MAG: hypothetical protein EOO99_07295 [Pedobacter sp.]|nr:MAG: hypothetical protein EOO99_07295 [Pedobacter sp.]